jgi:hypothetical protein
MLKRTIIAVMILSVLAVVAVPSQAVVPNLLSIQGKLTSIVAESAANFWFSFSSMQGGKHDGNYADRPTTLKNYDPSTGIFSCTVDLANPTNITDVLAAGDATVTIKVGPTLANSQVLVAGQSFRTVPYAFRAAVADSVVGGVDATAVTYAGAYPNVAAALDSLLHVATSISSFYIDNGNSYEIGSSVPVTLKWAWNKTMASQAIDTVPVLPVTATSKSMGTFSAPQTWTLSGDDGTTQTGHSASTTTSLSFYNKFYYGVSSSAALTAVDTLTGVTNGTTKAEVATPFSQYHFLPTATNQYMYFACPDTITVSFLSSNSPDPTWKLLATKGQHTNGGTTVNYNVYVYDPRTSGDFVFTLQ